MRVLRISINDELLAFGQNAILDIADIASNLQHPGFSGIGRDAGNPHGSGR